MKITSFFVVLWGILVYNDNNMFFYMVMKP